MDEVEPTLLQKKDLLAEIRILIREARRQTAITVNVALTMLYWRIGKRIYVEVLGSERGAYGDQIVATTVATIHERVWPRLYRKEPSAHDSIRRGVS